MGVLFFSRERVATMMGIKEYPWWISYPERRNATVRMFLFPYAGSSPNTFSMWSTRLPDSCEVSVIYLPGRLGKTKEEFIKDWRQLAATLGDAIIAEVKKTGQRYFVYGHSFGGLLAYLTVLHIRSMG